MGYLQDAELGLPWEGKPIEQVLADQQAQNVRLLKMVAEKDTTIAGLLSALREIESKPGHAWALASAAIRAAEAKPKTRDQRIIEHEERFDNLPGGYNT